MNARNFTLCWLVGKSFSSICLSICLKYYQILDYSICFKEKKKKGRNEVSKEEREEWKEKREEWKDGKKEGMQGRKEGRN